MPLRAASSAASLTRLARSAPTKPDVIAATSFRSTCRIELDVLHVDLEDRLAAADVGPIDQHVPVEAAGPQQGRDRAFRAGCVAAITITPLLESKPSISTSKALSVCSRSSWPPTMLVPRRLAQGVQLVDEDDAGRLGLGLLEHVADAGGADADEHFDEVGARQAEERHARLAGDRLGQQRLAGARRADQQHALGNAAAQDLVLFGRPEELDDFAQLFDRLVDAGHVLEGAELVASRTAEVANAISSSAPSSSAASFAWPHAFTSASAPAMVSSPASPSCSARRSRSFCECAGHGWAPRWASTTRR